MAAGFASFRERFRLRAIGISRLPPQQHFAGHFLPAAGNVWNGELNNVGSNGNYWSSTPNDENNAYNLNFNSGNANWNNNNNRNNGQSVRPVR